MKVKMKGRVSKHKCWQITHRRGLDESQRSIAENVVVM